MRYVLAVMLIGTGAAIVSLGMGLYISHRRQHSGFQLNYRPLESDEGVPPMDPWPVGMAEWTSEWQKRR